MQVKAAGPNLELPPDLSVWPSSLEVYVVAPLACWRYALQTDERSATEFLGSYVPPPLE